MAPFRVTNLGKATAQAEFTLLDAALLRSLRLNRQNRRVLWMPIDIFLMVLDSSYFVWEMLEQFFYVYEFALNPQSNYPFWNTCRTCIQFVLSMITNIKCRSGLVDIRGKQKEYSPQESRERED